MYLRECEEQEVISSTRPQLAVDEVEIEEDPEERALDGDYLLPLTLFEADKHLFDLGMMNLFAVLVAEKR